MISCPACQHENVDGTQFCEMCGEELPSALTAVTAEAMTECPQCGAENPSDNLACEACGADLHPGSAAVVTPPVSPVDEPLDTAPASQAVTGLDMPATPPAPAAPAPNAPGLDSPVTTGAVSPDAPAPNAPAPDAPAPDAPAVAATSDDADDNPAQTPGDLAPGNVKLVVEQGQSVGAQFVLGDPEMLVGREDEDADIYPDIDLSDQDAGYVHRQHADIKFDNGNLTVTHLGGANKTRINNKPIPDNEPSPLKLGDKVAFGKVVLRLLPV